MAERALNQGRERQALASGLAAVAAWSTVATGFKLGLELLAPAQLLLIGTALSALLFATLATLTRQWRPSPRTVLSGAAFGLINPLCYYLVLFEAYDRLPAQIAQPLNFTWAIMLAVLAVPVLGQPLTARGLLGIGVGYLGVLVLLSGADSGALPAIDWFGVALALASTLLWAGYWLATARTAVPPLTLMTWSFLFATPAVALVCVMGPGLPAPSWPALGYGAWVGMLEMGISFLLWQRALRLTSHAGRIGQLIFLAPPISLVLIGTVLGEPIRPTSVIGLLVILAGLGISRRAGDPG